MKSYKPLLANVAAQTIFGLGYFFIKMGMAVVDQDTVKFLSFRGRAAFFVFVKLWEVSCEPVSFPADQFVQSA